MNLSLQSALFLLRLETTNPLPRVTPESPVIIRNWIAERLASGMNVATDLIILEAVHIAESYEMTLNMRAAVESVTP